MVMIKCEHVALLLLINAIVIYERCNREVLKAVYLCHWKYFILATVEVTRKLG
jgi:hypothetical protein